MQAVMLPPSIPLFINLWRRVHDSCGNFSSEHFSSSQVRKYGNWCDISYNWKSFNFDMFRLPYTSKLSGNLCLSTNSIRVENLCGVQIYNPSARIRNSTVNTKFNIFSANLLISLVKFEYQSVNWIGIGGVK